MGQSSNDAALKGAQIKLRMEECALGMEQRSNDATARDAQIKLRMEECVSSMGQKSIAKYAAVKDARI
jgi:hypothetical protein